MFEVVFTGIMECLHFACELTVVQEVTLRKLLASTAAISRTQKTFQGDMFPGIHTGPEMSSTDDLHHNGRTTRWRGSAMITTGTAAMEDLHLLPGHSGRTPVTQATTDLRHSLLQDWLHHFSFKLAQVFFVIPFYNTNMKSNFYFEITAQNVQ
nr:uncharacterized protein LOC128691873 isoform X1 [Cherax quadricarinatus]